MICFDDHWFLLSLIKRTKKKNKKNHFRFLRLGFGEDGIRSSGVGGVGGRFTTG